MRLRLGGAGAARTGRERTLDGRGCSQEIRSLSRPEFRPRSEPRTGGGVRDAAPPLTRAGCGSTKSLAGWREQALEVAQAHGWRRRRLAGHVAPRRKQVSAEDANSA